MVKLSRRDFLKQTGLMGATLGVPITQTLYARPRPIEFVEEYLLLGRAFCLTNVYLQPDKHSRINTQLTPDSVHSIRPTKSPEWYQVEEGYIPRQAVQPIYPYQRPMLADRTSVGFWAELAAPSSCVRAWCAAHAPVVTRLGHGAVVYVSDYLRDDRDEIWYGLSASPDMELIGWSNALHFTRWSENLNLIPAAHRPHLKVDSRQQTLQVLDDGYQLYHCQILSNLLPKFQSSIIAVQPGTALDNIQNTESTFLLGVPWLMSIVPNLLIYGAYWHNNFGDLTANINNHIELPTFSARWLYAFLIKNSQIPPLVEVC